VLVVERLSDARRNGHRVLAVVAGARVNQDGTVQRADGAERAVAAASDPGRAGECRVDRGSVDVMEATARDHAGDPIEAQALLATYGRNRRPDRPLWLGSVKSNIGHTQAARARPGSSRWWALRHASRLPATLHVDEPSPHVDWSAGHVRLLTEAVPGPRRASAPGRGLGLRIQRHQRPRHLEQAPPETGDEPRASRAGARAWGYGVAGVGADRWRRWRRRRAGWRIMWGVWGWIRVMWVFAGGDAFGVRAPGGDHRGGAR
jgi:hypothetical protein